MAVWIQSNLWQVAFAAIGDDEYELWLLNEFGITRETTFFSKWALEKPGNLYQGWEFAPASHHDRVEDLSDMEQWGWGGFRVGKAAAYGQGTITNFWTVPYWPLVLAPTLAAACVFWGRVSRKPQRSASVPFPPG
jgi:hypothetical protein